MDQVYVTLGRRHGSGGSFREALVRPRIGKWAESPSLFVRPAKKQRAIKIKCAQTHFKSVLCHHASYRKETK